MTEKQRIDTLLKDYGFAAKKSFGQNFLVNEGIINRIISNMKPQEYETVIEIGPGLGSLTLPLSEKAKKLIAVDADRDMITILKDITKEKKNVTLVQSDFLRFDPDEYSDRKNRLFVGNLPYNITSELIEYLLRVGFESAGIMVQKEVGEKLDYKAGKKENNPLGCMISYYGSLSVVTQVDRSSFNPSPKVDSVFLKIDLDKDVDFSLYPAVKALFKDPNKTISNCLRQSKDYSSKIQVLKEKKNDCLALRARQLEPEEVIEIAKIISL
ncbi:MAG: 16S rRNA (adenine(1518)-N(6)/adenine(1519)-N(6))-dimethyltransferase RsmA [Bacilli bacterium]